MHIEVYDVLGTHESNCPWQGCKLAPVLPTLSSLRMTGMCWQDLGHPWFFLGPGVAPLSLKNNAQTSQSGESAPSTVILYSHVLSLYNLVGQAVKASASRAADLGSIPIFEVELFPDKEVPVTSKLVLQWLPCQAPDVKGSVLGLVGLVSVYCDWVRQNVWLATSVSVW